MPALLGLSLAAPAAAGCRDESASSPMPARPGSARSAGSTGAAAPQPSGSGACTSSAPFSDRATAPFLPARVADFCLDPGTPERAIGDDTPRDITQLCDLIDGECEVYRGYDVRRVVEARYVAAPGSPATVDVFLSRFASAEAAYGMFTRRVVGDQDPFRADAPTPIAVTGQATLGIGNAYLWHGAFLVELTLNDERASASQIAATASELLPGLVQEIDKRMPTATPAPAAASALPTEQRAATGVRYYPADLLGIRDAGPGAIGYYRDGQRRWRLARGADVEVDRAKDAMRAIGRTPGAAELEQLGEQALRVLLPAGPGAPLAEWLFARKRGVILGIGDERTVLVDGMSAEARQAVTLPTEEKRARLKAWLAR